MNTKIEKDIGGSVFSSALDTHLVVDKLSSGPELPLDIQLATTLTMIKVGAKFLTVIDLKRVAA